MSIEIVDTDNGFNDFFVKVDEITKSEVNVGYDQSSGSDEGVLVVDIAVFNEFGTESIPARPHMRRTFDNNEQAIGDTGEKLLERYLNDKIDANLAYEIWGDSFREKVRSGVITRELGLEDNAESTIQRKGSDTPLIDTKRMLNSMGVTVESK